MSSAYHPVVVGSEVIYYCISNAMVSAKKREIGAGDAAAEGHR
jgi:hypothetical protein